MEGIQQMFAEFMGYDAYEAQVSIWCYMQRSASAERSRDWRSVNREQVRRRQVLRDRRLRPIVKLRKEAANECRRCKLPSVPGKRSCEKHLAKDRARVAMQAKKHQESRAA